jgi:hypothetical protein
VKKPHIHLPKTGPDGRLRVSKVTLTVESGDRPYYGPDGSLAGFRKAESDRWSIDVIFENGEAGKAIWSHATEEWHWTRWSEVKEA